MAQRKLSDFPNNDNKPIDSSLNFEEIRCRLAGLINTGEIHRLREGGMIEVIHMLVEEIAELKERGK